MQNVDLAMLSWLPSAPDSSRDLADPDSAVLRRMRHNHQVLRYESGSRVNVGDLVSYQIDGLKGRGRVISNPVLRGGLGCNGMSVMWLIEEAELVKLHRSLE